MAPKGGQKKKKVTSNRGFATVSVPRKKDLEELEAEIKEVEKAKESVEVQVVADTAGNNSNANGQSLESKDEWDSEAMEKHDLQLLVDKIRPGIDKEVSRMGKVFEYERRMTKAYPSYAWTEQDLQRRILALALASNEEEVPLTVYEAEDKILTKIGTLFGILENMGFVQERIEECLRVCKALELEDVLDWLFLRCESSELHCDGPIVVQHQYTESCPPTPNPETIPSTPSRSSMTPLTNLNLNPLDEASVEASLRARILAYDDEDSNSSPEGGEDGEEDEDHLNNSDANHQYVKLKIQLSEIQRAQGAAKRAAKGKGKGSLLSSESIATEELREAQVTLLQKKMKKITGDYTFRKVDAELLYRKQRVDLDAAQLSARLNSTELEPSAPISNGSLVTSSSPLVEMTNESTLSPSPTSLANSLFIETTTTPSTLLTDKSSEPDSEEGSSELFGNMLDDVPETTDTGTVISIFDYSLPKHFSGKTPKINLEETVRKIDKYATVVFKIISSSRAFRASVSIRWDGGRSQGFEMQDVACYDQQQAFNYIATVALFDVNQTAANKQLPIAFRDLWDELLLKKKEEDDELYRERVKMYKIIAEARLQPSPSKDSRQQRLQTTTITSEEILKPVEISLGESQNIMQEFAMRQSWPAYQAMLRQRATLPIAAYRNFIMDTIDSSQCVVLCGETGCGKSTQVPSFIVEHEMSKGKKVKVFCTEPRRISAISLAQRVSSELGEAPGACGTRNSLVGYSIRLDSKVSPSSKIVYATTGIVLRMMEGRESLSDCTHIIIDEVHERSIDSDFLLIVLREILEVRRDLKVILMSATVDATKVAAYMGGCPVINVPGRTFPVTANFLEDVVELTGYRLDLSSDSPYVSRHMRQFNGRPRKDLPVVEDDDDTDTISSISPEIKLSAQTRMTLECIDHHAINFDLIVLLLENLCFNNLELIPFSAAILIFLPSLESIRRLTDILEGHPAFGTNYFLILPLHSTISNDNQGLVFDIPPHGIRKIVISTNLAETGVTIPDITSVIDTGKHREMRFDEKRQISRLVETFVAQSNAAQRRGRAGRVQEGICFHLFTKHRHDTVMAEHAQPEMMRLSLQDLALRIKIMKIGNSIEGVLLRALDPPLLVNIQRAISSLIEAKALTNTEDITPLGRHLAKLPMDVHLGKFLIMACLFGCVDAALTITATLNSKSPWLTPFGRESEADAVKRSFKIENSDFLTTYNAFCIWRDASINGCDREFTRKSFLSQQNLQMIEELRQQYYSFLIDASFIPANLLNNSQIPSRHGKSRIRFLFIPTSIDTHSKDPRAVMACLAAAMYPKLLVIDKPSGQMRTLANSAPAAIHPSSVNFTPGRKNDFGDAKFVAFFTAMHTKKLYIWESGSVDERAVYLLCGNAEFQLPAHSLSIDRKIRVQLEPKTSIAMKILRNRFNELFSAKMKNPSVTTEVQKEWFDLVKESLVTKKDEVKLEAKVIKKVHLSLHKNA